MAILKQKALLTLATGDHLRLLELSLPTFHSYADAWNYDLIVHTDTPLDGRPHAWGKIQLLSKALESYQEVLWIDADAIILDFSKDISKEVSDSAELALVIHDQDAHKTINSGVMLMRHSDRMLRFLQQVYDQADLIDHPWWENAAIIRLLGFQHPFVPDSGSAEGVKINVEYIDKQWNVIRQCHSENVRIRHFAGDSMPVRLLGMAEFMLSHPALARLKANNPEVTSTASDVIGKEQEKLMNLQRRNEALEAELNTVLASLSWRVSRPLRDLGRRFNRI